MTEHPANKLTIDELVDGAIYSDVHPDEFLFCSEFNEEFRKLEKELLGKLFMKWKQENPEMLRKAILSIPYMDRLDNIVNSQKN